MAAANPASAPTITVPAMAAVNPALAPIMRIRKTSGRMRRTPFRIFLSRRTTGTGTRGTMTGAFSEMVSMTALLTIPRSRKAFEISSANTENISDNQAPEMTSRAAAVLPGAFPEQVSITASLPNPILERSRITGKIKNRIILGIALLTTTLTTTLTITLTAMHTMMPATGVIVKVRRKTVPGTIAKKYFLTASPPGKRRSSAN